MAQLHEEFKRPGVYIRKVRRLVGTGEDNQGELDFLADHKHPEGQEHYVAATLVKRGKPIALYDSFAAPALVVSSHAKLGMWGEEDLTTPTKNPELSRQIVEESKLSGTYGGRPVKHRLSGAVEVIDKINSPTTYNEAQINFGLHDILALHAEIPKATANNPQMEASDVISAVSQTTQGWQALKEKGHELPLVEYDSSGDLYTYRSTQEYAQKVYDRYCGGGGLLLSTRIRGQTVTKPMGTGDCSTLKGLVDQATAATH